MQDTDGQFIGLTVAEDIAFALENDCVAQQEMFRRVDEAADMVDVKKLLFHAPGELSGGQNQRVSMAGVLVSDVDILLFDEPLANLDPATGKRTIALIDEIQRKKNTTVLIVEHRLEDALYRDVDRIIVMGEGRIVADTTSDELLATNILTEQGIREPLYLAALKEAGCKINAEDRPSHIETMELKNYCETVRNWYRSVALPEIEPEKEIVLELQDISYSYEAKTRVLRDINFQVYRGEMLGIVGKNGAGKSTPTSSADLCSRIKGGFFLMERTLQINPSRSAARRLGLSCRIRIK